MIGALSCRGFQSPKGIGEENTRSVYMRIYIYIYILRYPIYTYIYI